VVAPSGLSDHAGKVRRLPPNLPKPWSGTAQELEPVCDRRHGEQIIDRVFTTGRIEAVVSQAGQERHVSEIFEKASKLDARELTIDELEAVSGGGRIGDFIHRVIATYRFYTGTIKDIATDLS
jgi:hypothetical protein